MAPVPITTANLEPEVVTVKRQPRAGAGAGAGEYAPPALPHVGNEVDALLAVRLDPSQDDPEARGDA
jgi:hypothetical protein